MDMYQQQLELEERMSVLGLQRLQAKNEREREGERGYTTASGKMLMDAIIEPASTYLKQWLVSEGKRGGKRHLSYVPLSNADPELCVFIAAKLTVDAVMTQERLVTLARRVGEQVEDEVKYQHFTKHGKLRDGGDVKPYLDEVRRSMDSRKFKSYRLVTQTLDKALELHELEWQRWGERMQIRVGERLLHSISRSTELVQVITQQTGRKRRTVVVPGPGISELIEEWDTRMGLLSPLWLPCIIKPKPWTKPWGGGYHGPRLRRLSLVKTRNKAYLDDLRGVEMPAVYESINRLQDTPWSVNPTVLEVVQTLKEQGYGVAGLPVREDLELPPFPDKELPDFEEAKAKWKVAAREVHEYNALNLSRRLATERIVQVAEDFSSYDQFYFPHQLDFRGRVYPVSSDLQPQGCDLARGLLQFAEAKPIDTPEQARWLAVHVANCFGIDKVSMEERVDWVEENGDRILEVASDPLDCRWWEEADKPFQFLAACFDWVGLLSDGYGYESRLPVQQDGTCNGLQIFSLLLRDEVGGRGVNLVPEPQPQDIYQQVADQVVSNIRKILRDSPASQEGEWAERWLQLGVDRKLCKRPVMTLPYGVTQFSVKSFVLDRLKEISGDQLNETVFGNAKETREAAHWMGSAIWQAIGEVVIAARGAMDWLQKLAKAANEHDSPLTWWVPSGLPVRQHYLKTRSRRLKLHVGETWSQVSVAEDTNHLDSLRQANGVSPNFIHSLDGAALSLTVCRAAQYGVEAFSMVHDSYGTHAADAQVLADSLREVFVEMFDEKDLLAQIEDDARRSCPGHELDVPPRPPFGNLVVSDVLESEYFFA